MQYVKPKEHDETNYYQGVDLNDKKAVAREFRKRRATHTFFTLVLLAMFVGLGIIAFDYYRVYKLGGRPVFATKSNVDGGVLYKGIGYQVLYCDNDDRYLGAIVYQNCAGESKVDSYGKVLYDSLIEFATNKKILDRDQLVSLTINEYTFDEKNEKEGSDYLLDVSLECKNDSKCFNHSKEVVDKNNFKIIIRIDKFTHVYDLVYFKTSGAYYESLVAKYQDGVKQYLIDNRLLDENNLRSFSIRLNKNYGERKFRDAVYSDTYEIGISFLCKDGKNTCVKQFDKKDNEGDYSNFYYLASMFLDSEDKVALIGPKEYLDL